MALRLEEKQEIVSEISQLASVALSVVTADYRGISSTDMNQLRTDARKSGVTLKVVRNTLARKAFKDTNFECLIDNLKGPILLAFANEAPGTNARLLRDFAKNNEHLIVNHISLSGKLFGREHLEVVASLPTKDEAISKLMSVMQAPIAKLVRTLVEPTSKLVRTIDAVRESKQELG